jgi:hypothetical protein
MRRAFSRLCGGFAIAAIAAGVISLVWLAGAALTALRDWLQTF